MYRRAPVVSVLHLQDLITVYICARHHSEPKIRCHHDRVCQLGLALVDIALSKIHQSPYTPFIECLPGSAGT
jgi:hypothetical protein